MDTADGERKVLDNTTPLKKKDLQNPEIVRKVQVRNLTILRRETSLADYTFSRKSARLVSL